MTTDPGGHSVRGISVVILAGGKSQRLGIDKALLEFNGQSLLSRAVQRLAALSNDIIVVTSTPEDYQHLGLGVRFVSDERPGGGALMGIYSGLRAARHASALAVACDMPFLNLALLRHMAAVSAEYDVVVPRLEGDLLEPLHAIYGKPCLPFMADLLARGRRRIAAFFDDVRVLYVEEPIITSLDPLRLSFLNVNAPADWVLAQSMLNRHGLE